MASKSQSKRGTISLEVDATDLAKEFRDMNSALKTATVQSLNVVGRSINKEIATDIKGSYNIGSKTLAIGKTVRLFRANARRGIPTFTISILKKGRGLFLYSPKKGKAGISVRVKGGRKTVRGSFAIRSRNGFRFIARKSKKGGFVQRVSKTGKRYRAARSDRLFGPSVAQLYRRKKSFDLIDKVIKRDYGDEIDKQFSRQFEKKRR